MNTLRRGGTGKPMYIVICFFLAVGVLVAAGPDPVAEISVTPGQITWTPKINAEKWLLTVSGQGIYLREIVESGEPLRLQPNAPDGERLTDGAYNWELRAINTERRDKNEDRDQKPSSIRQRSGGRTVTFERRAVVRPVVTSGSFRVANGAFVMPSPEEVDERK